VQNNGYQKVIVGLMRENKILRGIIRSAGFRLYVEVGDILVERNGTLYFIGEGGENANREETNDEGYNDYQEPT